MEVQSYVIVLFGCDSRVVFKIMMDLTSDWVPHIDKHIIIPPHASAQNIPPCPHQLDFDLNFALWCVQVGRIRAPCWLTSQADIDRSLFSRRSRSWARKILFEACMSDPQGDVWACPFKRPNHQKAFVTLPRVSPEHHSFEGTLVIDMHEFENQESYPPEAFLNNGGHTQVNGSEIQTGEPDFQFLPKSSQYINQDLDLQMQEEQIHKPLGDTTMKASSCLSSRRTKNLRPILPAPVSY